MTDAVDNLPARAARDAVLRAKYHSLVEKYLSNGKAHAFLACTGFGATTRWVQMAPPSSGNGSPTRTEAFCKLVCSQRNGHNRLHECGRRWHDSLTCEGSGSLRFTCPFGVRNFWVRIRKALGARTWQIVTLFSWDALKWILISNLIAWPIAWTYINQWLKDFAYKASISPWIFLLSGFIVLLISVITLSFQAQKAARINPAITIKQD